MPDGITVINEPVIPLNAPDISDAICTDEDITFVGIEVRNEPVMPLNAPDISDAICMDEDITFVGIEVRNEPVAPLNAPDIAVAFQGEVVNTSIPLNCKLLPDNNIEPVNEWISSLLSPNRVHFRY